MLTNSRYPPHVRLKKNARGKCKLKSSTFPLNDKIIYSLLEYPCGGLTRKMRFCRRL